MKDMETQHSEVLARLTKEIQEIKKNEESTTNHDHNGPTGHTAKGEKADKEPTLPGPLTAEKQSKRSWKLNTFNYNTLTSKQKNQLSNNIKNYLQKHNKTEPQEVWIVLSQGSLIIDVEVDENPDDLNWPTESEMSNMVENAIQNATSSTTQPTMAERVKDVIDPWQFQQSDPWRHAQQPSMKTWKCPNPEQSFQRKSSNS